MKKMFKGKHFYHIFIFRLVGCEHEKLDLTKSCKLTWFFLVFSSLLIDYFSILMIIVPIRHMLVDLYIPKKKSHNLNC